MDFYIKRYLNALKTQRIWLLLAFMPVSIYLISAALLDRTLTVTQTFSYSGKVLVAKNPVVSVELDELLANPDLFFQEGFALTELSRKAVLLQDTRFPSEDLVKLRRLLYQSMSLSKTDDSELRIAYRGPDEALGRNLVDYYARHLMNRTKEALQNAQRPASPEPRIVPGALMISSNLNLWDLDRLLPAFWVLLISAMTIMTAIATREFSDPSFKSERQIARYLGLPILGTLPDAEPLIKRLNH